MPMANNFSFDFKQVFGKEFDDMSSDERQMAMMSQLYFLNQELMAFKKNVTKSIDCLPRHEVYFKIIGVVSGITATGLIGYLIRMIFY